MGVSLQRGAGLQQGQPGSPREDLELDWAKAISKEKEKGSLGQLHPAPSLCPWPLVPPPTAAIMTSPGYSMTNSLCSSSLNRPFWTWLHFLEGTAPNMHQMQTLQAPRPVTQLQGGVCLPLPLHLPLCSLPRDASPTPASETLSVLYSSPVTPSKPCLTPHQNARFLSPSTMHVSLPHPWRAQAPGETPSQVRGITASALSDSNLHCEREWLSYYVREQGSAGCCPCLKLVSHPLERMRGNLKLRINWITGPQISPRPLVPRLRGRTSATVWPRCQSA